MRLKKSDLTVIVILCVFGGFVFGTAWGVSYSIGAVAHTAIDFLEEKGIQIDKYVFEQYLQQGISLKYNNHTLQLKGGVENE